MPKEKHTEVYPKRSSYNSQEKKLSFRSPIAFEGIGTSREFILPHHPYPYQVNNQKVTKG